MFFDQRTLTDVNGCFTEILRSSKDPTEREEWILDFLRSLTPDASLSVDFISKIIEYCPYQDVMIFLLEERRFLVRLLTPRTVNTPNDLHLLKKMISACPKPAVLRAIMDKVHSPVAFFMTQVKPILQQLIKDPGADEQAKWPSLLLSSYTAKQYGSTRPQNLASLIHELLNVHGYLLTMGGDIVKYHECAQRELSETIPQIKGYAAEGNPQSLRDVAHFILGVFWSDVYCSSGLVCPLPELNRVETAKQCLGAISKSPLAGCNEEDVARFKKAQEKIPAILFALKSGGRIGNIGNYSAYRDAVVSLQAAQHELEFKP